MKKLITLLFLISIPVFSQYYGIDTLNKTVSTATYDTLRLGPGEKSLEVWNKTTGTLNVGFRTSATGIARDTVNIIQIVAGNKVIFTDRSKDSVMFIKSSVAGTVTVTVFYGGKGVPIVYYPVNSSGNLVTSQALYSTTLDTTYFSSTITDSASGWTAYTLPSGGILELENFGADTIAYKLQTSAPATTQVGIDVFPASSTGYIPVASGTIVYFRERANPLYSKFTIKLQY